MTTIPSKYRLTCKFRTSVLFGIETEVKCSCTTIVRDVVITLEAHAKDILMDDKTFHNKVEIHIHKLTLPIMQSGRTAISLHILVAVYVTSNYANSLVRCGK